MSLTKIKIGFLLLVVIGLFGYGLDRMNQSLNRTIHVGEEIPDFELTDLEGNRISRKDLSEQRYALLFFRVECNHCKSELMEINSLLPKSKEQFKFIAASLNRVEDTKKIKEELNLSFALYPNAGSLAKQLHLNSVPFLIIVDKGRIQQLRNGKQDAASLATLFNIF